MGSTAVNSLRKLMAQGTHEVHHLLRDTEKCGIMEQQNNRKTEKKSKNAYLLSMQATPLCQESSTCVQSCVFIPLFYCTVVSLLFRYSIIHEFQYPIPYCGTTTCYSKIALQLCVKSGGHLFPVVKRKHRVCQPLAKFTVTHKVILPFPALH